MRIWSSRNWRLLSKRGETQDFAPPAMRIESAWKTPMRLSSLRNAGSKRASKHQITTASQVYISRGELKCMIFCIHSPDIGSDCDVERVVKQTSRAGWQLEPGTFAHPASKEGFQPRCWNDQLSARDNAMLGLGKMPRAGLAG